MTIEYKDSKRIVGLSTDEILRFSDDFTSSPNGWTLGSGQTIESGYLYADGDNTHSSKPLAIGSPTTFTMDFDYAPVNGAPRITFMILNSEIGGYGAASSGHKKILFSMHQNGVMVDIRYRISGSSEVEVNAIDSTVPPYDGTISYYRMIKTSGNVTVKRYASDANRTSDTSSTDISLNFTESGYGVTADLAYLVVGGSGTTGGYSRDAKLYDFKFSSPAKPTDVPDNSILVEKDTARRYWRTGASALTEEQQLSNAELQDLNGGAKGMGEYVRNTSSKLYGKILTDIQFYLKKNNPQAGAKVYARHYSSSDVLIHTYWEKLASDLPTSLTWTTETTLSGDTAFANGDYFIIEYTETDGTTATGAVQTNRKDSTNANQWDGSNSGFINTYFGSSSYLDTGNLDIWFKGTTAAAPTWHPRGGTRGIFQVQAVFEYVTIATTGNATDFGDPTVTRSLCAGCNNDTRGILAGGGGSYYNTIDYITIATPSDATDFGNLTQTMGYLVGYNSDVRGVIAGGYKGGNYNFIDYITTATPSNATVFGDLTVNRGETMGAFHSDVRGVCGGGYASGVSNVIDYTTIATPSNATDFGDLVVGTKGLGGVNNLTRGVFLGGDDTSAPVIQYVTIATPSNTTDFGDLLEDSDGSNAACHSMTRGLYQHGRQTYSIQYITIDTTGNAIDFGDTTGNLNQTTGFNDGF